MYCFFFLDQYINFLLDLSVREFSWILANDSSVRSSLDRDSTQRIWSLERIFDISKNKVRAFYDWVFLASIVFNIVTRVFSHCRFDFFLSLTSDRDLWPEGFKLRVTCSLSVSLPFLKLTLLWFNLVLISFLFLDSLSLSCTVVSCEPIFFPFFCIN